MQGHLSSVLREGEWEGDSTPDGWSVSVRLNPCAHQVAPGQPQPPNPELQLLTLGGRLSCLGAPHLGKHLLARAPHQRQVGIDADLSVLLGALVQAGEHGSLPRAGGKSSLRDHPPPPRSTMSPHLHWLQQVAPMPCPSSPDISRTSPDTLTCGPVVGGGRFPSHC